MNCEELSVRRLITDKGNNQDFVENMRIAVGVVTAALLVAILPNCRGKIRHLPQRTSDSDKVPTELGKVSFLFPQ